ncbi:hypothetical protein Tsubulata_014275 [Turnera subulata]|uniref:Red chlorophyll catabolite reductase n=1 Tax=Turnera subulata TaxID=218843 RepID=A0A9Q0FDP3_9ROSI|nr:hypothetical protein Tsubulata_014275 [Turnera subulata]
MEHNTTMRGPKLMEFPHLLDSHRDLMVGLVSAADTRLHSHLLPSSVSVPSDVEYYENPGGVVLLSHLLPNPRSTSDIGLSFIYFLSYSSSAWIDFILVSWLRIALPTGGGMNVTNIQGYLKPTTDAPHFQFELVQLSPTFLIFFLDLTPRKDLVLHPDYLKTFYEDTQLEARRKQLESQVPESNHYFSSSLYFRNVVSPTGILVGIKCDEEDGAGRVEEIIRSHISPIANEVLEIWMESCVCRGAAASVGENERAELEKRDRMIKSKAVDMDLSSSMPKQFGQEVADRVLGVIRGIFRI